MKKHVYFLAVGVLLASLLAAYAPVTAQEPVSLSFWNLVDKDIFL